MIVNQKPTASLAIQYSVFSFYLTGSRAAGTETVGSDWDFFVESTSEVETWLEATWMLANPGYNDLNSKEDFESVVKRTPEAEFRTKRCNQWVSSKTAWLPAGVWDGLQALVS